MAGAAARIAMVRSATSPIFGVGLAIQSCEAQERLTPVLTSAMQIAADSGGPGKFRGGCGVIKGGKLTEIGPHGHVVLL